MFAVATYDPTIDAIETEVSAINHLLRERDANQRKSIALAFKLGKHLTAIRDSYHRGEWTTFVLSSTDYKNLHEAQADMRLWETWKSKIIEKFGNTNDYSIEYMVKNMTGDNLTTSVTALQQFAKADISPFALDMAIKSAEEGGLTVSRAKRLVESTRLIDKMEGDAADFSRELMNKWGVDNPNVIQYAPRIVKNPELAQAILLSGTIHVPNLEDGGDEISIDQAGKTDLELALGLESAEKTMIRYVNSRQNWYLMKQGEATNKDLLFMLAEQIFNEIDDLKDGEKYQLRVYRKVPIDSKEQSG